MAQAYIGGMDTSTSPLRRWRLGLRRGFRRSAWLQIAALIAVWFAAEAAMHALGVPVPGGIVGLFVLLLAFGLHWLSPHSFARGAQWLLAEMLLFFVPAVVAVVNYAQLLMVEGWKIFLVIAISTMLTLGATGLVVDRVYRLEVWLQRRKQRDE